MACRRTEAPAYHSAISAAYSAWCSAQTAAGRFLPRERCQLDSVMYLFDGDNIPPIEQLWCIERPAHIDSSFCDMNGDGVQDGFYGVFPLQCDMSNNSMWSQLRILVLSTPGGYTVNDSLFDDTGDELAAWLATSEEGFLHIDSISNGLFHGRRIRFKEGDPHCCPSVEEPQTFPLSGLLKSK